MNILEKIVASTRNRVEKDKAQYPEDSLAINPYERPAFAFEKALKKNEMAFICEVKKASPSKGIIAEEFQYLSIAKEYEQAGADAISVLTEPEFFLGKDEYLQEIRKAVTIPLLRKDFVIDAYQIKQAKSLGADGVLLFCSLLTVEQMTEFIQLADSLGLSCLVEAHTKEELEMAIKAGARIVGVNNRNLRDFTVDCANSVRLRGIVPDEIVFVSESGIQTNQDIVYLQNNNVNAVLIGETLMRAEDKKKALGTRKGERNG